MDTGIKEFNFSKAEAAAMTTYRFEAVAISHKQSILANLVRKQTLYPVLFNKQDQRSIAGPKSDESHFNLNKTLL